MGLACAALRTTARLFSHSVPSPAIAGSRQALKGVTALFVAYLLLPASGFGEEAIEHPIIQPKDIKADTCLTCHPEKKQGEFVHTAVAMGCENCHQVISEKNRTTITLVAAGGALCAKCHAASKDPVLHAPYKSGQCLICHDPHSSRFRAQTRSARNSLCLECHGPKPPTGDSVSLFNLQRISRTAFDAIPKIELDPTLRFGHPQPAHPVAEAADPLHPGEKMSCLSCHSPHASTLPALINMATGGENVCDVCHRVSIDQRPPIEMEVKTSPPRKRGSMSFGGERCAE
jgi:predicted CXXCH cytochrome family protein